MTYAERRYARRADKREAFTRNVKIMSLVPKRSDVSAHYANRQMVAIRNRMTPEQRVALDEALSSFLRQHSYAVAVRLAVAHVTGVAC